ncbi:uncharacterized protein LOC103711855 [Phoenix dactylifera]|uniref:Uncharacterized protein LOC103711855 n=1 Tax=Phoenix dactylifera TaxID=42345 RepID=A0A8B7CCM3_PHODC|nr:uncharacterized protein LOC103711855 [Phoenix dactylifera]
MYPQLKVREQEDTNMTQEEATSYPPRIMESLSVEVHSSSGDPTSNHGKMSENDPPSSDAKIYSSHPKNLLASSSYTSKGKNSQSTDEDNRTNIRASSVPRPRAVLSSPDNDDIIGNQNRLIKERHTLLKRQSLYQNIQAQGKLSHRNARVAGPLSTRKVSKESGDNRLIKERKLGPEVDALKQRSTIRRG